MDLLSALTSISPNVPFLVLVETAFLAQSSDVLGYTTFVITNLMMSSAHIAVGDKT